MKHLKLNLLGIQEMETVEMRKLSGGGGSIDWMKNKWKEGV